MTRAQILAELVRSDNFRARLSGSPALALLHDAAQPVHDHEPLHLALLQLMLGQSIPARPGPGPGPGPGECQCQYDLQTLRDHFPHVRLPPPPPS